MAHQLLASLDIWPLLAIQNGDDDCLSVYDGLSRLGFYFVATETVIQELGFLCASKDPEIRAVANATKLNMVNWNLIAPNLSDLDRSIAKIVAGKITQAHLEEENTNDGLVIAESAAMKCVFHITNRSGILTAAAPIRLSLMGEHQCGVTITSPSTLAGVLKQLPQPKPTGQV